MATHPRRRAAQIARTAALALTMAAAAGAAETPYATLPDEPQQATDRFALADGASPRPERTAGGYRMTGCMVDLMHDIELPAPEAGVLTFLGVREGDLVTPEQVIARIDDRESRQALRIAEYALRAAEEKADDDVDIRYSQAAAMVARAEWEELTQANASVSRAVTQSDIRKAKLEYDRSLLGAEKAEKDMKLASLDAQTKAAELEAARLAVDRRSVLAPFEGVVLEVFRETQEWVQPGDPVIRVARLDRLQVDGFVYFDDFSPSEVDGREVTIQVELGRGQVADAAGRIVFADPVAHTDGKYHYLVRAEIENRRQGRRWMISPKLPATMTIHVDR